MLVERNYVYSPSLGLLAPYTNEEQLSKIVNHFNEREDLYHKLPISFSCQEQNFFEKYSTSAGINLTTACQLRCNYCTYKSGEQDITLNEQDVYAFINFLVKNLLIKRKVLGENGQLKIYFSGGGEPTYHWDLLKNIVLYIQKMSNKFDIKYDLYITTNGMLNNQQIAFLMENFTGILISFDGLPDIQGRNRKMPHGFSSFDVVKNVLDILNKNNYNFSIRTTIWPHNYFLLNDMARYIFNTFSNVKKWEIFPVSQQGRAENTPTFTKNNTQSISNYSLCESYLSLLSNLDKKDFYRISIPLFKNYETLYECGTAFGNYPWLNSDGKIITCIEAKEMATVLGEVSNGIVTCNRYIDSLSIEHIKSCNKTCFDCIAYRYCGCGCPLKNSILELGSEIQQDWICANMKEYWKVVFDNLIERREFNGWKLYLQGEESNINYYSIGRVL